MPGFIGRVCNPSVKYTKDGEAVCRVVLETTDNPHELADNLAEILTGRVKAIITLEQQQMEEE